MNGGQGSGTSPGEFKYDVAETFSVDELNLVGEGKLEGDVVAQIRAEARRHARINQPALEIERSRQTRKP